MKCPMHNMHLYFFMRCTEFVSTNCQCFVYGICWWYIKQTFVVCVHSVRFPGVPTARSLSVVTSSERVTRPWYTHPSHQTMQMQGTPPRCHENEAAAMLCRSARSFWRVGHVELFARRGERELADFLWHVFGRDFPHLTQNRLDEAIVAFFEEFVKRQAELVAEWLRVGYVHGNMNSDNCLLCSQTLDFGPFAFMEAYDPGYQPFTSDKKGHWQKLTRIFFIYIYKKFSFQVRLLLLFFLG